MAWRDDISVAVLEEFVSAGAYSSLDAFHAEADFLANRAERGRDHYHTVIKSSPHRLKEHRERQLESVTAIRERRRAEGKCLYCEELRDPESKALCTRHRAESQARYAMRRRGMREKLPDVRDAITHHFTIIAKHPENDGVQEIDGYISTGVYEDGRLGEIFIRIGKTGANEAMYEQWAIAASMALQYGVPVDAFFGKFLATNFEPFGATTNKIIPRVTSVLDYVARWVLSKYGSDEVKKQVLAKYERRAEVQP